VPAGPYPPSPVHLLMFGLDVVITLILAVLVRAERQAAPSGLRSGALILGPLGVLAGLLQIGVRLTSDHAWHTGHFAAPVLN
jgi:hypothetical protein